MGLGGALAYVGAGTLMALWYPERLALAMGLTQFIYAIGSAIGQPALAALAEARGWRQIHVGAAFVGTALAVCMWVAVRRPAAIDRTERQPLWPSVRVVLRNPACWLAAIYASATIGTIFSYGVVWNVALQEAFGNTMPTAAGVNAWLFVGFGVGAAAIGGLAARQISSSLLLTLPVLLAALLIGLLIFLPRINNLLPVDLATAAIGAGCGASVVAYGIVALAMPPSLRGTAIGFVNAIAFFAAAGLQAMHGMVGRSSLSSFRTILWVYPLILIVAALAGYLLARQADKTAQPEARQRRRIAT